MSRSLYENISLDMSTGLINEFKFYIHSGFLSPKFVLGFFEIGFSRKSSIDFAEFLTEADPLIVSLPLKFSNSCDVLNVIYLLFYFYSISKKK